MGNVNWNLSAARYASKSAEISANVQGSGWLHFLDALGWMESSNNYDTSNGSFKGKYQVGIPLLSDMGFLNAGGLGAELLGVTSHTDYLASPIAQNQWG